MNSKSIAYITLGCKLNYAETSTYERKLSAEGFTAVQWTKGADIFLVNTCTVTEHSDKKSRNIIRKLHRLCPEAKIYVTGCYAQLKKVEIEAIEGVPAVFGAEEKSAVVPTNLTMTAGKKDITFVLYDDKDKAYKIRHLYANVESSESEV